MKKQKTSEYAAYMRNFYAGGLVAINLIFIQSLLGSGVPSIPLRVSILAFSIALPPLVGALIVNAIETQFPYRAIAAPRAAFVVKIAHLLFLLAILLNLIGVCAALWSIWWVAVLTLIAISLVSAVVYIPYVLSLEEEEMVPKQFSSTSKEQKV